MSKTTLLKGTAILSIVGVITRLLGFFYKIFLSKSLGPEMLGVYQLIFPVYSVCYNIYGTGIQTTISRFVAAELGKKNYKNAPKVLGLGLLFSLISAILLTLIVCFNADFIATNIIYEGRIAPSLRILAIVFPFCGITACINGYYYGLTKSGVAAMTQLLEQIVRISIVYALAMYFGNGNMKLTTEMAVAGLVIGEISSTVFNIIAYHTTYDTRQIVNNAKRSTIKSTKTGNMLKSLLKMSIPLTSNRLIISVLISVEAVLIPAMLRKYGLSNANALSIYGIINVMVKPLLMFPSTITNSLSVLLLPTISEAAAIKNKNSLRRSTNLSIKYSLLVGIFSTGLFLFFGEELCLIVFGNQLAGNYLLILAWLCPFLYIGTTLNSILNGLNKVHVSFFSSVTGLSIRIFIILFIIPQYGISGYFLSLLISQLFMTFFEFYIIYKATNANLDAVNTIGKPGLIVVLSGFIIKKIYNSLKINHEGVILLFIFCIIFSIGYLILLSITKVIKKEDFK